MILNSESRIAYNIESRYIVLGMAKIEIVSMGFIKCPCGFQEMYRDLLNKEPDYQLLLGTSKRVLKTLTRQFSLRGMSLSDDKILERGTQGILARLWTCLID